MNIIDIFYNEVLEEISNGKVNCGFLYNTIFNTFTEDKCYFAKNDSNNLYIPTLIIKDKNTFNNALNQYVKLAYNFYDINYYDNEKEYIKAILTLVWSNATIEDFSNPIQFLEKRIDFLNNNIDNDYLNKTFIGTSENLGDIEFFIKKETICEETPYSINFIVNNELLPNLKFGISNNTAYFYAIHNRNKQVISKKLNRKMYKIDKGLNHNQESCDNNNFENIKDVTPSNIVVANAAIALLMKQGINKFEIISFLPVRWNAKELFFAKQIEKQNCNITIYEAEHERIQNNISDKFIRTFRRICHHFKNYEIISFPYDFDSSLHIKTNDNIVCNNDFLLDIYSIINSNTKKR